LICIPSFPQTAQDASFKFTTINYVQNAKNSSTSTKPSSVWTQVSGNDNNNNNNKKVQDLPDHSGYLNWMFVKISDK